MLAGPPMGCVTSDPQDKVRRQVSLRLGSKCASRQGYSQRRQEEEGKKVPGKFQSFAAKGYSLSSLIRNAYFNAHP